MLRQITRQANNTVTKEEFGKEIREAKKKMERNGKASSEVMSGEVME